MPSKFHPVRSRRTAPPASTPTAGASGPATPTTPRIVAPPLFRSGTIPPAPSLLTTNTQPRGSANIHPHSLTASTAFVQPAERHPQLHQQHPATNPPQTVSLVPTDPHAATPAQAQAQAQTLTGTQHHAHVQQAQGAKNQQHHGTTEHMSVFRKFLPPRFQNCLEVTLLLSLVEFLMIHRPDELQHYSKHCCDLYMNHFSHKKKKAAPQTPNQVEQMQTVQTANASNPTIVATTPAINGQTVYNNAPSTPNLTRATTDTSTPALAPAVARTSTDTHHGVIANSAHQIRTGGQVDVVQQNTNPVQNSQAFHQPTVPQPSPSAQVATARDPAPLRSQAPAPVVPQAAPSAPIPVRAIPSPAVPQTVPSTSAHGHPPQQNIGEYPVPPPPLNVDTNVRGGGTGKEKAENCDQNIHQVDGKGDGDVVPVSDEKKADWELDEPEEWKDKVQLLDAKYFVQIRYQCFMKNKKELESNDEKTPLDGSYVIWRNEKKKIINLVESKIENIDDEKKSYDNKCDDDDEKSPSLEEVLLPKSVCLAQRGLVGQSKQFPPLFLSAIRFFWTYLVAHTGPGGAIFSHGIGFPTQHLLWLFVRLYFTTFANLEVPPKKVLIITTDTGVQQWVRVGNGSSDSQFKVSPLSASSSECVTQQSDEIEQWQLHGGVLVCSYDQYIDLTSPTFETESNGTDGDIAQYNIRDSVFKNLCRKGPDIAILDEATRLATFDPMTRALFSRMSTRSRLALTSVGIGGNLSNMHAISSWTCPTLLGRSSAEFWTLFMEPIVSGNRVETGVELGLKSYYAGRCIWRALRHIMFAVEMKERRDALETRGKCLSECLVELNFSTRERLFYKRLAGFLYEAADRRQISCYLSAYLLSICTISIPITMKLIDWIINFGSHVKDKYNGVMSFLKGLSRPGSKPPPTEEDALNRIKDDMKLADMADDLGSASRCLSALRDIIKQDVEKDGPFNKHGRKLVALKKMVAKFTAMKDRVVVFASCELLREELVNVLDEMRLDLVSSLNPLSMSTPSSSSTHSSSSRPQENVNQERKQMVFLYDPNNKPNAAEQLRAFNLSIDGAVLIAPYGSSVSCSEDDGWSFINATKVVMLEYSWIVQPVVQALHRVHNFAWQGSFQVDVIYLKSVDSIDSPIEKALTLRFMNLSTQTSSFSAQGFTGEFPCHRIAGYRGFLIEPELSPMFLKPPASIDTNHNIPKVPEIVRSSGGDVSPQRGQFLEQLKDLLLTMESKKKVTNLTGGLAGDGNDIHAKVALSKFQFNVTRYYELCNILELPFVSDSDILLRTAHDEEKTNPFEKGIIRAGPQSSAVTEAIRSRVIFLLRRDPSLKDQESNLTPFAFSCLFSYVDSSLLNNAQTTGLGQNGMFDLWRYYFMLYESSERRAEYILPVPMRGDSDAIRGDESSSKGENMQNDGDYPRRNEGEYVRDPGSSGRGQDYEHRNGNNWNSEQLNFSNNNNHGRNIQNRPNATQIGDPAGPNPGRSSAYNYDIQREAQYNILDDPDSRSGASNWVDALDQKRDEQNNQKTSTDLEQNEEQAISAQDKLFRKRGRDELGPNGRHEPNSEPNHGADFTPHMNNPIGNKRHRSSEENDSRSGVEHQQYAKRSSWNGEGYRNRGRNSRDSDDDYNGPRDHSGNNRGRY